jgi:hypothetical protein
LAWPSRNILRHHEYGNADALAPPVAPPRAGSRTKASLKSDALSSLLEPATTRGDSHRVAGERRDFSFSNASATVRQTARASLKSEAIRGPSHLRQECAGSGRASSWLLHRACEGGTAQAAGATRGNARHARPFRGPARGPSNTRDKLRSSNMLGFVCFIPLLDGPVVPPSFVGLA